MLTNTSLLSALRQKNVELYSPQVQIKMEQLANEKEKQEFIKCRESFRKSLHALERQNLGNISARIEQFEEELNQAIQDLDKELDNINNTVRTLGSIRQISSLLARIVTI